ncbi:GntR family transcriptional regulator [Amycolatopsis sp. NPDC051903]|uniref:GntR family transcriptional regulator n=1 Tax=Amycolatopsis sp. NPDC051903 TaxID=3363936 RepID=UPI0037BBEACC
MNSLDPDDSRPAYMQVADKLRTAIRRGDLVPGDQLPTYSAIATEHGIAIETAKRALGVLRTEGLVVSRQGKGSFVRLDKHDEVGSTADAAHLSARLDELTSELEAVKRRLTDLESRGGESE